MTHDREKIKKDITDQLYWDDRVDAAEVDIHVSDGKVELSGTVPTFNALRAAEMDAYTVPGVKEVKNDLALKLPPCTR